MPLQLADAYAGRDEPIGMNPSLGNKILILFQMKLTRGWVIFLFYSSGEVKRCTGGYAEIGRKGVVGGIGGVKTETEVMAMVREDRIHGKT